MYTLYLCGSFHDVYACLAHRCMVVETLTHGTIDDKTNPSCFTEELTEKAALLHGCLGHPIPCLEQIHEGLDTLRVQLLQSIHEYKYIV